MNNIDHLLKISEDYCNSSLELFKQARIKKMPSGKYRVLSEKGKNLGESDSKAGAVKRLQQVEYFKHKDQNNVQDKVIDLTKLDDFSYSAVMRELRQKCDKEEVRAFLKFYKKHFDNAIRDKIQKPEKVALQNALLKLNKICKLKLPKKLIKKAAITELGNPAQVGEYLANIVKFTLNRISPQGRPKALDKLKHKFYSLNEGEISGKNLPASSAMGQAITFVKHVLFNHDPHYIREVLNNLVRFL